MPNEEAEGRKGLKPLRPFLFVRRRVDWGVGGVGGRDASKVPNTCRKCDIHVSQKVKGSFTGVAVVRYTLEVGDGKASGLSAPVRTGRGRRGPDRRRLVL